MLFLLSPAKALDFETPVPDLPHTRPMFVKQSAELIKLLRNKSPQQIATLMRLSDSLACLSVARYQAWRPRFTANNARQAVLAFNGDVYLGLDARSLSGEHLCWLQDHIGILSGLYGLLRPLDYIQAYRLEMGTSLTNTQGRDLYSFWSSPISSYLHARLQRDDAPVLVNLASHEYFRAVDRKVLKARVVECVFQEYRNGQYKVVSFFAKRARGLMARFAALHRVDRPEKLKDFEAEGYAFHPKASGPNQLIFRRRSAA
jgi:cytoplasmic iron level regulating protein YaaA (DUF328/UPF0246 family)